jgi:pimeloyl-ACP methyl ester carboxylesterase
MKPQAIFLPGGVMPADLAYADLIAELGERAEVVAKDLEVYGASEPPSDYTLEHEIDGVLRAAGEEGFDRFHLVGYSAGGASSLAFAARHPQRLLSLALIEPAWMGNEGLGPEERAVRQEFDRITALEPHEMMARFVAVQLAPGVAPPAPPPPPPPPWMASRPAGLRALTNTFESSTLDLDSLRSFDRPVYFAVGGRSNPDYYARIADRARDIFPDIEVEVFAERHHFDPPHRIEPERTAESLLALWTRAEG